MSVCNENHQNGKSKFLLLPAVIQCLTLVVRAAHKSVFKISKYTQALKNT